MSNSDQTALDPAETLAADSSLHPHLALLARYLRRILDNE